MIEGEKTYHYHKGWLLLDYFGILFFLALTASGIYWLFKDPFFSSGWGGLFVATVGSIAVIAFVFEKNNRATIIVNDKEIVALKPKQQVRIVWSNIDRVYYSAFQDAYAKNPFFSLYILSKDGELIKITQNIDDYFDLMEMIVRRSPRGQAEPISLIKLLRLLFQVYFSKGQEKGGHRRIPHL